MIVNLSFELHQDYVEEIMNALGIVEDEYKEIVEGKRADKQFTCDIYDAADVISEYIFANQSIELFTMLKKETSLSFLKKMAIGIRSTIIPRKVICMKTISTF